MHASPVFKRLLYADSCKYGQVCPGEAAALLLPIACRRSGAVVHLNVVRRQAGLIHIRDIGIQVAFARNTPHEACAVTVCTLKQPPEWRAHNLKHRETGQSLSSLPGT